MNILHGIELPATNETSHRDKRWDIKSQKAANPHLRYIEQILGGVFDHTATLIYDLSLQGGVIKAPLALLSLSGITLFYPDHRRGIFRVRSGEWEQLDERRNQYRPSKPNPVQEANSQVDALRFYLAEQGFSNVTVQAVILFTDPGIHVEGEGNNVRLVYKDGFPRFAANLARAQPALTVNEVRALVPILAPYTLEEALASQEIQDDFSFREEKPLQIQIPQIEIPLPQDDKLVRVVQKVPFTQRQLVVIAILVIVNILVLIALVLVILAIS